MDELGVALMFVYVSGLVLTFALMLVDWWTTASRILSLRRLFVLPIVWPVYAVHVIHTTNVARKTQLANERSEETRKRQKQIRVHETLYDIAHEKPKLDMEVAYRDQARRQFTHAQALSMVVRARKALDLPIDDIEK